MSSLEAVKQIKEAEAQAESIIRDAMQSARNLVNNAEEESEGLARQLTRETMEKGKNLMAETEAQAAKRIESLKQENHAKIMELRTGAKANLDEAVSFVLGRIVKDYGHN